MENDVAAKLLEYLNSGVAFVQEQAPDVAKQILSYGAYETSLWMRIDFSIGMGLIVLAILLIWTGIKAEMEGLAASALFPIAIAIGFLIAGVSNKLDLVKIERAPKVYLLEQIAAKSCKK